MHVVIYIAESKIFTNRKGRKDKEMKQGKTARFKITWEIQNEYGEWFKDWLDNAGMGFESWEAEQIRHQLYDNNLGRIRNVNLVRI